MFFLEVLLFFSLDCEAICTFVVSGKVRPSPFSSRFSNPRRFWPLSMVDAQLSGGTSGRTSVAGSLISV